MDAQAEIIFKQLLVIYFDQLAKLNSALNNSKELNNIDEYEIMMEYTPIKIYIKIKRNAIFTIINIRTCISVITKSLAQVLGLK